MFRKGSAADGDLVLAANVALKYEADQIKELLEREGIPAVLMDREDVGSYLRVLGYGSPFGVDILVHRDHEQTAKELIKDTFSEEKGITDEELEQLAMEAEDAEK